MYLLLFSLYFFLVHHTFDVHFYRFSRRVFIGNYKNNVLVTDEILIRYYYLNLMFISSSYLFIYLFLFFNNCSFK